jgi:hypothetical protein
MTCSTNAMNARDPGGRRAVAEHPGLAHVIGGQIRQRPTPLILVIDPHHPRPSWWQAGMAATPGLDRGLLVTGDHILLRSQFPALPAAVIQIQHPLGLHREVRVAGKDPRPVLPGLDRVPRQPPAHRRRRDRLRDILSHRFAGQFRTRPPGQRRPDMGGQLTGQRRDLRDLHRG